jgi:hypothetical protein
MLVPGRARTNRSTGSYGEKSSGQPLNFPRRRYGHTLINAISWLSFARTSLRPYLPSLKYITLSEGYPPWVPHRFCDHHKRRRKTFRVGTDPCPLPVFTSPLWSVALSVPAGWHLPYLVSRPSVYSLSLLFSSLPCTLTLSLGIIYSDIGTSPLYVLNGIWPASGPVPPKDDVIGAISAIVWSLTFLPLLKYVRALFCPLSARDKLFVNVTRSLFVCVLARTKVWAAQQYLRLSFEPIAYN